MNLDQILDNYERDSRVLSILSAIKQGEKKIYLKGLAGSSDAIIAAAIFRQSAHNHLFICNDKEEAAYLADNLRNILPKKDIHFFPDSFKRPGRFDEINSGNILLRTETVNRITQHNSRAELVVTYPEALFEKVVKAEELHKSSILIQVGEKLDIDTISGFLVDYGFDHVDFVYEPGQFSIRGGIVDVFSYANEFPYRIELYDQDIESIRTFNPETQLSEKRISRISIIPNIKTQFSYNQKASFLDVLPDESIIWIGNAQSMKEQLEHCLVNAKEFNEKIQTDEAPDEADHFMATENLLESVCNPSDLLMQIQAYPTIEFGQDKHLENALVFEFNIRPQTSFNKHFDLLIAELRKNTENTYTNFIFSDNNKQIERFYAIFNDLKTEVSFYPIYSAIHSGFIDDDLRLACYTDHQIFNRFHKYAVRQGFSRDKALLVKALRDLQPGDFVTHIDHGVGRYSGLEKIEVNGQLQEAVRLIYAQGDMLYVSIHSLHKISKYSGKEGQEPKMNKLGSDVWQNLKNKTKARIKDIAEDLIKLYAKRRKLSGFAFSPDSYLQTELEASFIYEDTPDQFKATNDVKEDMQKARPMDRLVCGDVGFGKTEVAIRAAFKAVCDGKQVAVLVPTTILAHQHYHSFKERLDEFKIDIDYINRFRSAKEKSDIMKKVSEGKVQILIGTHSIVGKSVKFQDLGLLIIDEEQKFGVTIKEKLKELKANVDTLTLTATPIPRTLQFSLMGARDLSVINTPPPNRQPVQTEVKTFSSDVIKEAIEFEVYRGGQVFFVHNRVNDIMDVKLMLNKICPDVSIGVAHGQMEGDLLEDVMMKFMNRELDVLLCTNIIESGLNIPNANTIIINNGHTFGLSDLHQLRGRVGRSNKKAFCYLISPPFVNLTQDARQRLKTIEEFADLGSGFNISMRDMDIRGAGNILGAEQSGFISEIGYDMYHKILDEAIRELKETDFKELYKEELEKETDRDFVRDCQIDTDLEMLIPDSYISNITERMSIYTEMNNIEDDEQLKAFAEKLKDRFGKIPKELHELFNGVRIKWLARKLGMQRIVFKNRQLKGYFIENQDSIFYKSDAFGKIMKQVQGNSKGVSLKQAGKNLILAFEGVTSMKHALEKLEALLQKDVLEV